MANQNDGRRAGSTDLVVGIFVIALAAVGLAKLADYMDRNISGNAIICDEGGDNQINKRIGANAVKRSKRLDVVS